VQEVIFTEDQLQEKCAEWQKILRLQDWIVSVSIVRERDIGLENTMGTINPTLEKRMAKIRILDPVDYPSGLMEPQDMELTLVHELLHLHLWPFTETLEGPLHVAEEQSIEAISRGLVELRRRIVGNDCCFNKNVQTFGPNEAIKKTFSICISCGKILT